MSRKNSGATQENIKVKEQKSEPRPDTEADDLLLQNLGTRLRAAETKRAQFLVKYAPNYPLVRDADHEVAEAKAAIAAAEKSPNLDPATDRDRGLEVLRERLAHDQAEVANLRASLVAIGRGAGNTKAQKVKPSGRAFNKADVEREARADEQNYLLYLSKRERERTDSALDRRHTVTVTIAAPPTLPASPAHRRGVIVLIALALATFVAFRLRLSSIASIAVSRQQTR